MNRSPAASTLLPALFAVLCWLSAAAPAEGRSALFEGYMDHAALSQALQQLGRDHPSCSVGVIGASRQERELFVLSLAADQAAAGERPAVLIVAGLDGTHLLGTESAVRVARTLLEKHADLLKDVTFYILPRINPDAAELNLGPINAGMTTTVRAIDNDRDGVADEDGPSDLNGDGVITMMRRENPPLDDAATHTVDPADPRLLKAPDAAKGERPMYSVYIEGLDTDGDGLIAEDGLGGVDLDKNFMHRWPEFEDAAGPYQLCEPESEALVQFVLAHRNIVAAITYGRHDNLINVPDGRGNDVTGTAPRDLDAGDVPLYQEISRIFKETTGQTRAVSGDTAGSFEAWLYAQRGLPSFATNVWGRPDAPPKPAEKPAEKPADAPADGKPAPADQTPPDAAAAQPAAPPNPPPNPPPTPSPTPSPQTPAAEAAPSDATPAPPPDAGNRPRGGRGRRPRPGDNQPPTVPAAAKVSDEESAAWLAYSDRARDGAGFIPWQPFEHPTLGHVEIGGFVPGFKLNPPAAELDGLAEKQAAFAVALASRVPKLSVVGPDVTELAAGLYEVRFGIANDGYLPTSTAMARKARAVAPTVLRLSTPIEQLVAGDRVSRTWGIDGSGARFTQRWILRAAAGSEITIDMINRQLGQRTITFTAATTKPAIAQRIDPPPDAPAQPQASPKEAAQ